MMQNIGGQISISSVQLATIIYAFRYTRTMYQTIISDDVVQNQTYSTIIISWFDHLINTNKCECESGLQKPNVCNQV